MGPPFRHRIEMRLKCYRRRRSRNKVLNAPSNALVGSGTTVKVEVATPLLLLVSTVVLLPFQSL